MSYKAGQPVIVTQDNVNRVGVVLDRYMASKRVVYDVLLENRSAVCMISSKPNNSTYVNTYLSDLLCSTGMIQPNIPYADMVANDLLPITKT